MNKSNYLPYAFFCMLFAINTSWDLNERFRGVEWLRRLQIKRTEREREIKVAAGGIDGFQTSLQMLGRAHRTMRGAGGGFEETARASCSAPERQ